MSEEQNNPIEQVSILDRIQELTDRSLRSFGHMAKVIHLELAERELNPELAAANREKFVLLEKSLGSIATMTQELESDIRTTVGTRKRPQIGCRVISDIEPEQLNQSGRPEKKLVETPQSAHVEPEASQPDLQPLLTEKTPAPETPIPTPSQPQQVETKVKPAVLSETRLPVDGKELYKRFLEPRLIPQMSAIDEKQAIKLVIWANNKLAAGNAGTSKDILTLPKNELFLCNALMYYRDRPASRSELRELGDHPMPEWAFRDEIKKLSSDLKKLTGKDVVHMSGARKTARYQIDPQVTFDETRMHVLKLVSDKASTGGQQDFLAQ